MITDINKNIRLSPYRPLPCTIHLITYIVSSQAKSVFLFYYNNIFCLHNDSWTDADFHYGYRETDSRRSFWIQLLYNTGRLHVYFLGSAPLNSLASSLVFLSVWSKTKIIETKIRRKSFATFVLVMYFLTLWH